MKSVYMYTAITTHSNFHELVGHITTSFTKVNRKLPKIFPRTVEQEVVTVSNVVYWKDSNVTVALVPSEAARIEYQLYKNLGLDYEYEFIPHVTLCPGNLVEEYKDLIGKEVHMGYTYIGFIEKED